MLVNHVTLKSYLVALMVILLRNIRKVTSVILVIFSKYFCYITSLPQKVIILHNTLPPTLVIRHERNLVNNRSYASSYNVYS